MTLPCLPCCVAAPYRTASAGQPDTSGFVIVFNADYTSSLIRRANLSPCARNACRHAHCIAHLYARKASISHSFVYSAPIKALGHSMELLEECFGFTFVMFALALFSEDV
jgi:hypothetical protein